MFVYTKLFLIPMFGKKEERHLLDRYSKELHLFITSSVTEGREFTAEDLIRQWKADQHAPVDVNSESAPPPKKKRLESKTNKSEKPRKPNKDKARQKKSIESSSALAAQEIIAFTPYNSVFPSVRAPQQPQLQDLQQEDDLLAPHSQQPQQLLQPNSLLHQMQHQRQQYGNPIETQQQQHHQYQRKQQLQNERLKQHQNQNQQQQLQHQRQQQQQHGQRQQQLQLQQQKQQHQGQRQHPVKQQQQQHGQRQQQQQQQRQRHHGQRQQEEKQQQQQKQQEQHQDHQKTKRQRLNQQSISPLQEQQGQQLWDHSTQDSNLLQQSNQSYLNMLEDVVASSSKQGSDSSDDFSCLGTTCAAITTAMTTLSDYNDGLDDFTEDPVKTRQDVSLDDSGILISDSDIDDGNEMNHKEDPCSELQLLREKIRKLEEENDQLKARQSVYESTGEFSSLFLLTILTISKKQSLFQAFILSD